MCKKSYIIEVVCKEMIPLRFCSNFCYPYSMNISEIAAIAACTVLGILVIFQLALILGAPIGKYAWGGTHTILPKKLRIGSMVSIVLYIIFAGIILGKASLMNFPVNENIINVGIWVLTVYFFVGVLVNGISRSKPERAVMTPTALLLAVLCLSVASN